MADRPRGALLADFLLLLTVMIWAVNFSVVKMALAELPPLAFNGVRFLCAVAVMGGYLLISGRRWHFERRHLPWLVALGVFGHTIYQLLFIYGAAWTTADNAALMLSTVPAWVALTGTLAGMERVRPMGWLGILLSLLGIVLILTGGDRESHFRFGGATLEGDALVLLATILWSGYTLLSRLAIQRYGSTPVTTFCTITGSVPLLALTLPTLGHLELGTISTAAWLAAIVSGTFAVGIAYFFWNYGIAHLGSARTALYSNLMPPLALLTAWLWLGETLTPRQGFGAVLTILGVLLARRHTRPRSP